MDRRPPLAMSPRRLRPRRVLRPLATDQTPPATTKTQFPIRSTGFKNPLLRPEYQLFSSELIDLAKRVSEEFGNSDDPSKVPDPPVSYSTSTLFERGRFYELYSARRNERLKRKKGEIADEAVGDNPGVAVELAKRRNAKKAEGLRKSVPVSFAAGRASSLRSSVRSSKEMKKASATAIGAYDKPATDVGKRIVTRSVRRI